MELRHLQPVPYLELENHIHRFQLSLQANDISGALIIQTVDLFYFSGTAQHGYLYIPAQGKPVLMVKKSFDRARLESTLETVVAIERTADIKATMQDFGCYPKILALELDVLPVELYFNYQKLFPEVKLVNVADLIREVRMVKTGYEVGKITKAASLFLDVIDKARSILRPGMTELELAAQIEAMCRQRGHMGIQRLRKFNQYLPSLHVLAGANGGIPSYFNGVAGGEGITLAAPMGPSYNIIKEAEPIYVDFSFNYDGYHCDITRVFTIGKLPVDLQLAFEVAVEIQEELAQLAKPGVTCGALFETAIHRVRQAGLEDHFMGYAGYLGDRLDYVGHGIGLEVDELPVLTKGNTMPLQEQMVIAIEPTFIFPNRGAIGIEDDFLITADGGRILSNKERTILQGV